MGRALVELVAVRLVQPADVAGELDHRLHDRREARDGADAQVVAVGEAARDDDRVDALEVAVGMPEEHRLADALAGQLRVDLVAASREPDHPELHAPTTS